MVGLNCASGAVGIAAYTTKRAAWLVARVNQGRVPREPAEPVQRERGLPAVAGVPGWNTVTGAGGRLVAIR